MELHRRIDPRRFPTKPRQSLAGELGAIYRYAPRRRPIQAKQDAEQSRLAGSRDTDDGHMASWRDAELGFAQNGLASHPDLDSREDHIDAG